MPVPGSLTISYDSNFSSTLFNFWKGGGVLNAISTSNNFFFTIINKKKVWTNDASGQKLQVNLRYENGDAQPYSGYDVIPIVPMDGHTAAFFDWGQMAVVVAISGKEQRENAGNEVKIYDLQKAKVQQAVDGIKERFNRAFLQGNGINSATAIQTGFTNNTNGAVFIDPLAKLVAYAPTNSLLVGNLNQQSYSWWQNQTSTSVGTTYSAILKELDHLYNNCSKGPGGPPDFHLCDQSTYELYVAALRKDNRFTDYKKADLPFESVAFHANPVSWDEYVPNASGTTTVQSTTAGTWYMLNTEFIQFKNFLDFEPTPFIKPDDQDAQSSRMLYHGGVGVSNRRKHGVMGAIATGTSA